MAGTTHASPVAVIDIGSNSIKLLVAARGADQGLTTLCERTEETRIGAGIAGHPPRLREDAMDWALESVRALLCEASRFEPAAMRIVATSAVRDAVNGPEFAAMLFDATTLEVHILSGTEEARLIGRGIACDPDLRRLPSFYLFDLGGGSLEMIAFQDGAALKAASLQLGCVRVTERCVADPTSPLPPAAIAATREHVSQTIAASGFAFSLPRPAHAVVTGGTATTARAMRAMAARSSFRDSDPVLRVADLENLAARLAGMPAAERAAIPGLPPPRADVMPAALLILVETARAAGVELLQHSLFNLRYGVAVKLLEL